MAATLTDNLIWKYTLRRHQIIYYPIISYIDTAKFNMYLKWEYLHCVQCSLIGSPARLLFVLPWTNKRKAEKWNIPYLSTQRCVLNNIDSGFAADLYWTFWISDKYFVNRHGKSRQLFGQHNAVCNHSLRHRFFNFSDEFRFVGCNTSILVPHRQPIDDFEISWVIRYCCQFANIDYICIR